MKIKIFTCGGTIDKIYYDDKDDYTVGESIISHLLEKCNLDIEYEVESLVKKDSLYINSKDLDLIRSSVKNCSCDKILITHGTDTMIDISSLVSIDKSGKRIVFTGSMKPARFIDSDALFNIAYALGFLTNSDECGVFIAMHGKVFNPLETVKNVDLGKFQVKSK